MSKTTNLSALSDVVSVDSAQKSVGINRVPAGNGVLELDNIAGNNTSIVFSQASNNKWLIGNVTGSDALRFYDLANGVERMRIDSAGRVTMPYQPAFMAVLPTNSTMVGGLTTIPFTTVLQDVSNGLNNGNFTAPVSGNYFISATLSFDGGKDSSDDTGFFGIYKNNVAYIRQVYNPIKWSLTGVENTTAIAGVVYLSAGDTVQIRHYEITQTPSPKFLANFCNFSGYLIG